MTVERGRKMYQVQKNRLDRAGKWLLDIPKEQWTAYTRMGEENACRTLLRCIESELYIDKGEWQRDFDMVERMVCREYARHSQD